MRAIKGYRLGYGSGKEIAEFIDGLRLDALRILARHYSKAIAEEAVRTLDLHAIDLEAKAADQSPLKDAIASVRNRTGSGPKGLNLDCRIAFHFVEEWVLLRVIEGHDLYHPAIVSMPGVSPFNWSADGQGSQEDWQERGRLWDLAFPTPRLGSSLKFQLIDGPLPSPRWASVKRWLPDFEARARRAAQTRLWRQSPFWEAGDLASFKKTLASPIGGKALDQSIKICRSRMKRTIERDDLIRYGAISTARATPARPQQSNSPLAPRLIDHADILETIDGRVFVAVPYAGLSTDDRVYVQIVERTLSFVQLGKDFGQISDVSNLALDLLRDIREVTVVELIGDISKKSVKAKHVALVSDISPAREYASSIQRWKSNTKQASRQSTEWMENE